MGFVTLLYSINWKSHFFYWINEKLTLAGWEMKVEESSGSLIGTSYLKNIILTHTSGSKVIIEKLAFNLDIISSILNSQKISFDLITMEGLDAEYDSNQISENQVLYQKPKNIPFEISTFFIDGRLRANIDGDSITF